MLRWLWFTTVAGLALLAAACSSAGGGEPSASSDLAQKGEAAGITVEATWLMEDALSGVEADLSRYPLDDFALLTIVLDTHSGDLTDIDMEQATSLRQGEEELRPQAWLSTSDDSHHRAGVLVFPRRLKDGPVELLFAHEEHQMALRWEAAALS